MSYTVITCAARSVKERVDNCDYIIGKDPAVLNARARIAEMLECLRRSLTQFHVPPNQESEKAQMLKDLKDLEDMITELEAEDVLAIAKADIDGAALAMQLGLMFRQSNYDPCDQDGEGRRTIK